MRAVESLALRSKLPSEKILFEHLIKFKRSALECCRSSFTFRPFKRDPGGFAVISKVPAKCRVPRALLARTPVPRVSGAVLAVWGQSGESRGRGRAAGRRGKSMETGREPACASPLRAKDTVSEARLASQGRTFRPRGRAVEGQPRPLPSFGRPPGLSKPGGGRQQGFPESEGEEVGRGQELGARTLNLQVGAPGAPPPAPPHARSRPRPPRPPPTPEP
ncbi:hypothetical protein AB1E18_009490 [Capra hircus]